MRLTPLTDLITPQRAQQNPQLAAIGVSNPAYLASLITAASRQCREYTFNDFQEGYYSEYYNGGIYKKEPFLLRHDPVIQITRVATLPTIALQIINNGNNQRATIQTVIAPPGTAATSPTSNVVLSWVSSAVTTTATLTAATYPTLGQLSNAINAVGNGWNSTVQGAPTPINMNSVATADLKVLQGAVTALSGAYAYLEVFLEDSMPSSSWAWADNFGWEDDGCSQSCWRLSAETGEIYGRFPRGQQNIRIDYQAGYATIPQDVQEACLQQALFTYNSGNKDWTVESWRLGPSGQTLARNMTMPPIVMQLLSPYRRSDIGVYRG